MPSSRNFELTIDNRFTNCDDKKTYYYKDKTIDLYTQKGYISYKLCSRNELEKTITILDAKYRLLITALRLADKIFIKKKSWVLDYSEYDEQRCVKKVDDSTDKSIDNFVQKNGVLLPINHEVNHEEDETIETIPICAVVEALHDLFMLYLCWCFLVWREETKNISYLEDLFDQIVGRLQKKPSTSGKKYPSTTEKRCKSFIKELIKRYRYKTVCEFYKERLVHVTYADSLMGALVSQMLDVISQGTRVTNGCSISECSVCGNEFEKRRKNHMRCEKCRKPYANQQQYRNRQKLKKQLSDK